MLLTKGKDWFPLSEPLFGETVLPIEEILIDRQVQESVNEVSDSGRKKQ